MTTGEVCASASSDYIITVDIIFQSPVGIEHVIYCVLCHLFYHSATTAAESSKNLFILARMPSAVTYYPVTTKFFTGKFICDG